MGFLKFLKREPKERLDELDLPPSPPSLEGFDENPPEIPDSWDFEKQGISAKQGEMPKFDFNKEEKYDFGKEEHLPDFPSFPEMEDESPAAQMLPVSAPPADEPLQQMPQPLPPVSSALQEPEDDAREEPRFMPLDSYAKTGRGLFSHGAKRERTGAKTVYVRVDKFKATLGSINMVRSDLRKSEEALSKLENLKLTKDKSFDRLKSSIDDLQRKLIFFDKTLFKGGD